MNKSDFTIGQKVWFVRSENYSRAERKPVEYTITKIGNKWVTLGNNFYKFNIETMDVDGGQYSSPGKIYLNPEDFYTELRIKKLWNSIGERMYRNTPTDITEQNILEAAKLLKIDITGI
jgi:hypothetical protein